MMAAEWLHDHKRGQRFIEWGFYLAQRAECKLAKTAAVMQQQPLIISSRCIMRLFPSSRNGYKANARKKSYEKKTSVEQHQTPSIIQLTSKEVINHSGKSKANICKAKPKCVDF
jgi:hypothetical protein